MESDPRPAPLRRRHVPSRSDRNGHGALGRTGVGTARAGGRQAGDHCEGTQPAPHRQRRLGITNDPNHKPFFAVPYDRFDEQWGWSEGPVRGGRITLLLCPPGQATERLLGLAESPLWRATRANALLELGHREEAIAELNPAREAAPEERYVAHELVLAYLQLERWEDARQAALRAIELSPSTECLYRHLEQAYLREGLFDEAIERAEGWLEDPARGAGPALLKARALSATDRGGEAAEVLETAVRDHPDSAAVHDHLAELRVMARDFAGAVEAAKAAIRLDPQESAHHVALVTAHLQMGETDQASLAIEGWIEAVPDEPAPFLARANFLVSEHPEEAAKALEQALECDPENVEALANLGALSLVRGDYAEAIRRLRRVLELDPGRANGLEMLGIAYLKMGQIDDALLALRKAVEMNPRSVQAHKLLGTALLTKGRPEQSIAALQKAVGLAPGDAEVLRLFEQASEALRPAGGSGRPGSPGQ